MYSLVLTSGKSEFEGYDNIKLSIFEAFNSRGARLIDTIWDFPWTASEVVDWLTENQNHLRTERMPACCDGLGESIYECITQYYETTESDENYTNDHAVWDYRTRHDLSIDLGGVKKATTVYLGLFGEKHQISYLLADKS